MRPSHFLMLIVLIALLAVPSMALAQSTGPPGALDPDMSNLEMWAILSGFFLPIVIARIQSAQWSDETRAVAGFAVCLVAGVAQVYLQNLLIWTDIVRTLLFTMMAAYIFYLAFWKPLGITKIERGQTSGESP